MYEPPTVAVGGSHSPDKFFFTHFQQAPLHGRQLMQWH